MSSQFTPFQVAQQRTAVTPGGLYNASGASSSCTTAFPPDDGSATATSFSSGLYTPLKQLLLSPFGTLTLSTPALSSSIGYDNGAYIELACRYELLQNEFNKERQEHGLLK